MPRIELVDAIPLVEQAAQVLRESWRQPCIHYTSSYIYWQLTYRGDSSSIAAMAFDGDRLIGQAIVIPRRMRVAGQLIDMFHLTFVCVLPQYRGQGIALNLYRELLSAVAKRGWPILAFTLHDSLGDRAFAGGLRETAFTHRSLGDYIVHGYLMRSARPGPADPSLVITRAGPGDDREYIDLVGRHADSSTLAVHTDKETLEHWSRDPRRPQCILVRREGKLIAAARIVRGQIVTLRGIEPVTSVEHMTLREDNPVLLESLAHAAGSVWSNGIDPEFVSFPNIGRLNESLIRAASIRRTATKFLGHLAIPPSYDSRLFDHVSYTDMAVS